MNCYLLPEIIIPAGTSCDCFTKHTITINTISLFVRENQDDDYTKGIEGLMVNLYDEENKNILKIGDEAVNRDYRIGVNAVIKYNTKVTITNTTKKDIYCKVCFGIT